MSDRDDFEAALDRACGPPGVLVHKDDQPGLEYLVRLADVRGVYADWLEERGLADEAFAQRWMAWSGVRAYQGEASSPGFRWFDERGLHERQYPHIGASGLPFDIGRVIFGSRRAAEAWLTELLARLRREGRPVEFPDWLLADLLPAGVGAT